MISTTLFETLRNLLQQADPLRADVHVTDDSSVTTILNQNHQERPGLASEVLNDTIHSLSQVARTLGDFRQEEYVAHSLDP
jgi:hypothetical protein